MTGMAFLVKNLAARWVKELAWYETVHYIVLRATEVQHSNRGADSTPAYASPTKLLFEYLLFSWEISKIRRSHSW